MDLEKFVIDWNSKFPLDRWYRKKHNLRFNSTQHRGTNLVDVYFEFIEDRLYNEAETKLSKEQQKFERYKKNGWLEPKEIKVDEINFDPKDLILFDDD